MFRFLFVLLLVPTLAHAQALVAAVLDASGVPDTNVRRVQRATEAALKQVSSLSIGEGPAFKKGAPRRCGDDCAQQLATSLNAAAVVLLDLKATDKTGDKLSIELQLWLDGEKVASKRGEGTVDGFDVGVRPALEALLPGWARKGFGGLSLQVEPGTVVKVDGRLSTAKPGEVLAVPAGVHAVDVVFPEGHAVLQRLEVAEGSRVKVEAQAPTEAVSGKAPKSMSALRGVSYGTFMAGAAVLAAGLVVGAAGRGTAEGLSSCSGDVRNCATLVEVQRLQAESDAYANTGNVLMGVGGGLAATGVVLFIIDAVTD